MHHHKSVRCSGDEAACKYYTTIIYPVYFDEPTVQHELFRPVLPVVPYMDDEILDVIASREHGLTMYISTNDVRWAEKVMRVQQFGGGCINEVYIHMMVKGAPFNGTGHSGMGTYTVNGASRNLLIHRHS